MSCGSSVIVEPINLSSNPILLCYDSDEDHFFQRQNLDKIMGHVLCYDVKKLDSFLGYEHSSVWDIKLFEHVKLHNSLEALYRSYFGDEVFTMEQTKQRITAAYKAARAVGIEPNKENYSHLFDQDLVLEYHKQRIKAIYKIYEKINYNNLKTYNFKLMFSRALHQIEKNKIYVEGKEFSPKIKKNLIFV